MNKLKYFPLLFLVASIITFTLKAFIPSYIDPDGLLHEPFYLLILGYIFMFLTIISTILILIKLPKKKHPQ